MGFFDIEDTKMNDIKTDNLWLMYGDCLERMKEIPNGSVNLILCVIIDNQLWR